MIQKIACPNCKSDIMFDIQQLLSGASIKCTNATCEATIQLSPKSTDTAYKSLDKIDSLKRKLK